MIDTAKFAPVIELVTKEYNAFMAEHRPLVLLLLLPILLVVGFFGKRLFGVFRVCGFLALGFLVGYFFCSPYVQTYIPAIPAAVTGAFLGILLAVLSKFIYNAVYVGVIGFDAFNICFSALFFPQLETLTKGNWVISIAVAVIVVAISLILRKYIEMIGTAAVGGIGFAFVLREVFVYTAFVMIDPDITSLILGGVLAMVMLIFQYITRLRW